MKQLLLGWLLLIFAFPTLTQAESIKGLASSNAIEKVFDGKSETIAFIENDTYLDAPETLLGRILVIQQGDHDARKDPEFEAASIVAGERTKPKASKEVVQSIVVDKGLVSNVGYLGFLAGKISDVEVASIVVKNELSQRINQSKAWNDAVKLWKTQNKALLNDPKVAEVLVVEGYVLKSITFKKYAKKSKQASVGAYGINIDGDWYASHSEYEVIYCWGLDYTVLKAFGENLPSEPPKKPSQAVATSVKTTLSKKSIKK